MSLTPSLPNQSLPHLLGTPTLEEMKAELEAVLASKHMVRAPTLARFLSFICEEYFGGRAHRIKEYTIAVEAFGRPTTFEPKEDPIVRVDANRLRARLAKHYRAEGKGSRVQITLPKGQYAPEFRRVTAWPGDDPAGAMDPVACAVPQARGLTPEAPSATPVDDAAAIPTPVEPAKLDQPSGSEPGFWGSKRLYLPLLIPLAITAFLILLMSIGPQPGVTSSPDASLSKAAPEKAPQGAPAGAAVAMDTVRILAGSVVPRYVDQLGKPWMGDRFFTGGRAEEASYPPLLYAGDKQIWRRHRGGDFQYDIPLKPGSYDLRLYFSEPIYGVDELHVGGETTRLFNVTANGRPLLSSFDITASAGGPMTADVKTFAGIEPDKDGQLHLRFASVNGPALINAIELTPGVKGRMKPFRITTRNVIFFSEDQTLWCADQHYWGGRSLIRQMTAGGVKVPELYNSERFGNFSYRIPVAPGKYTVRLHFIEAYFGPSNPGGGEQGMRIFEVHCNGVALLKDFDLYREAGGANKALVKEFRGLRPNAQGNLELDFEPVKNYACVSAIEVLPET